MAQSSRTKQAHNIVNVRVKRNNFRMLGPGFLLALAIWIANAVYLFVSRTNVLDLYRGDGRAPFIVSSDWVFVPVGVISALGAAGVFMLTSNERKKYRIFFRLFSMTVTILGVFFLLS